jgi:hypothetical protein
MNESPILQVMELLGQHLGGNVGDDVLQLAETECLVGQVIKNDALILAPDNREGRFNGAVEYFNFFHTGSFQR